MKKPVKKNLKKIKKPNKPKTIKAKNQKISDEEFLRVIDIISKKLAYKFKFGYHDINDMKQQISVFALEGLKNYDHKRPLENFLWTHVRNRLFNYKRDNYQRPDKPCLSCPLYDPKLQYGFSGCKEFSNKENCELYNSWSKRNTNKKKLMHLNTIDEIKDYGNSFEDSSSILLDNITNNEIIKILDEKLQDEYRIIYLKMKQGNKVTKAEVNKLSIKIKFILQDFHYE